MSSNETEEAAETDALQRNFLLFSVAMISLLFLWMISGFLMALLLGALTAGFALPLHQRLARAMGGRKGIASALVVIGLLLVVIGPLTTLLGLVVSQAVVLTQGIGPWLETTVRDPGALTVWIESLPILAWLPVDPVIPERERVIEMVANAIQTVGSFLVDGLAAAGRGTALFMLQVFIYLYSVFFFLLTGSETLDRILHLSPLDADDEDEIVERFVSVTRATLRGSVLIGGLQGLLTGLGFAVAGISGAAFWGMIVVVLSVIPGVGAPIVWIPAVLWLLGTGNWVMAAGLALWSALVVGSVDNVLRPRLVGSDASMSDLMIMVSTLGGISLFGPAGFIVGPIVAAIFVTLWNVYGRAFSDSLPPTRRNA